MLDRRTMLKMITAASAATAMPALAESKAKHDADRRRSTKKGRELAKLRKARLQAAVGDGTTLVECEECETIWDEDELVLGKLRECPHCSTQFVAEERNCPDCNRPFTRVEEEKVTCPDCISGGSLPEVLVLVKDGVQTT